MANRNNQTLGELILSSIKEKGLNQSKIADKMNVKRQTINQLDRRKTFDIEFLQNLKHATGLDFTGYLFPGAPSIVHSDESDNQSLTNSNNQQVEMSLAIKLKADPDHISRMGELLINIRKEASRLGFTIL